METVYRVTGCDTLSKIALRFNTTPELIISDNRITGEIYEGQRLYVRSMGKPHTVKPFETYESIASHYGVGVEALVKLNRATRVFPGRIIIIPDPVST
jgi:LysM repeat protein